jgi:hypothetical protein
MRPEIRKDGPVEIAFETIVWGPYVMPVLNTDPAAGTKLGHYDDDRKTDHKHEKAY